MNAFRNAGSSPTIRERIREHAETAPNGLGLIGTAFGIVSDAVEELHRREAASEIVPDALHGSVRGTVDVLGKLLDRLPDALTVAEVVLVLDRFDVALRGHHGSPSVGAVGDATPLDSDLIVGDASGVDSPAAPDATSGDES